MEAKFNMNFIISSELSTYSEIILNKINKGKLEKYEADTLQVFTNLAKLQSDDNARYKKVAANLSVLTEDFVIRNSSIISKLISITEDEETKILANDVTDNIFNYVFRMNSTIDYIVDDWVNEVIESKDNNISNLTDVVDNMANEENKRFVGFVYNKMVEEYANVGVSDVLSQYLVELVATSYKLAHDRLEKRVADLRKSKDEQYGSYRRKLINDRYAYNNKRIGKPRKI